MRPFGTYCICGFVGNERTTFIEGLSYDAAKHIAMVNSQLGEVCRLVFEGKEDYNEVWINGSPDREGEFAEVTLVQG